MSQQFALLTCILLIFSFFWLDRKSSEGLSKAIWLPFLWLFFTQTRNITEWFSPVSPTSSGMADGSPLNKFVYLILIILGIIALRNRKINWYIVFTKNRAIWLFFFFGALSLFWSDYPFVSLNRWIKGLGVLIMALVVATEPRPNVAIGIILNRLAFILLPLSVLFIKFYPELGRVYHMGIPMYTGVCSSKNSLGALCLFTGIYFIWSLVIGRRGQEKIVPALPFSILAVMIPIIIWLLRIANSATAIGCMIVALCLFVFARLPIFVKSPHKVMISIAIGGLLFISLEWTIGITDIIISMLGREPDLTNRMPLWENYLSMVKNPFFGSGYEVFYTSAILQNKMQEYVAAHNGYLEVYLNLGIIGVFLVVGVILTGLTKVWNLLIIDYEAAIFRLSLIMVIALYGWTETAFSGVSTAWMLLLFACFSVPPKVGAASNATRS